ncbi:MAG: phosphogluconate dehydratase [Pseudomonadota bacterium]
MTLNVTIEAVTERIRTRSEPRRTAYLRKIDAAASDGPHREAISCGNLAHGVAACDAQVKSQLIGETVPNIGMVSAYNDMLSAHQPYERYPDIIRDAAAKAGAVAQFAGGVPAMCDGVTQGQPGMDLSLFSRDVIAMATAVALSHNMFDAVVCMGICDKIVPGLLIGSLTFGHLPTIFIPAGPMPSGLPNKEKARVREAYAAGDVGRDELIAAESASYHSPGTCTFYGTANSNQMLMEFMGLQLPGGSFINPGTDLREQLTRSAVLHVLNLTHDGNDYLPIGHILDERAIVNGIVGLLCTGGSTNHTIHLIAIAAAAGISIDWDDFAELSRVVPLLAQVYPNGTADVNHFHAAGGLAFLINELLGAGLLHGDVKTIVGDGGLARYATQPRLDGDALRWDPVDEGSGDRSIVRGAAEPFQAEGGIRLLKGSVGRAVVKISAVASEHRVVTAPARVFKSQAAFVAAFEGGELEQDVVVVLPFQGPKAIGMPELHKLTPYLSVLQNRGFKVALLTDGRMSGASGKVLAAIHVSPEAEDGGAIGRIQDGDVVSLDADAGTIEVGADLEERSHPRPDLSADQAGCGRELFATFRRVVGAADTGASVFEAP